MSARHQEPVAVPNHRPQSTPWLRGSRQGTEAADVGSRRAAAIDIAMNPRTQMCILVVVGLAAASICGRWAMNKCNKNMAKNKSTADASSPVDGFDPESGHNASITIESTDLDVESGGSVFVPVENDIESGGAIRTTDDYSLHDEEKQACVKTSEKSASVLTMGASSSEDMKSRSIVTADSSASDVICLFEAPSIYGGSSIPNSSARSFRTWATKDVDLKDHSAHVSVGSAAAVAAQVATSTGAAPPSFNHSGRRSSGGAISPLSMRTFSLPTSDGFPGATSPSEADVGQCSSGSSGTDGGNSDGDDEDDGSNYVDHDVLMAALRGAGIMVEEGVGGSMAEPHEDPEDPFPASVAEDDSELPARIREGETPSTLSLNVDQYAEEETGGEEHDEVDWNLLVDGYSVSSMPELVHQNEPGLAKERTEELVRILSGETDLTTALWDIYLARQCNLDLTMCDTNGALKRNAVIGAGYYGRVSRVEHEPSGTMMALKELTEEASAKHQHAAGNEIDTFLCLGSHRNILKVLAIDSSLPSMPILMELGHCDMVDVITSVNVSMPHKIGILHDAACGLLHMHNIGKVHRDIKAGNIIVTVDKTDGSGTGKVADLGLTCDVGELTPPRTGTPGYLPVEFLWEEGEARPENDVFSFGVLMLEVLVLSELWENNMFAHSSLLSAEEKEELEEYAADAGAVLDIQCEVMARTLKDGSFGRHILQPENMRRAVEYPHAVCGWLQACLCQPRDGRPDMPSVEYMLRCLKEGREPPQMEMLHYM